MTRSDIDRLKAYLTDRDRLLVQDVEKYRLLTSRQVQRLHFDAVHPTALASARACHRTLARLRDAGVLKPLQRRIGGARSGSAGYVWYLGPAGERLMQSEAVAWGGRRNYREPSRHFIDHTLAIAEVAVQAVEAARQGDFELLELQSEPASWQNSLSRFGTSQVLKPDIRVVTATDEYEHHWFIEVDMATEHLPVIGRQCAAYAAYRATGRYEARHGLFPAVVWVVPTEGRRAQLNRLFDADKQLSTLCRAVAADEVQLLLRAGATDVDPQASPGGATSSL